MKNLGAAFVLLSFTSAAALAQDAAPDPAAGKTLWETRVSCAACHGDKGEGGFGPDLAGRGLSPAQFIHAVRKPWGAMPAFVPAQVSDADLNNLTAYFASLPKVAAPADWRVKAAADAPHAQKLFHEMGCAQCHGPTFDRGRLTMGGLNASFDQVKELVYTHTDRLREIEETLGIKTAAAAAPAGPVRQPPPPRMGNFNDLRLSEGQLKEIYDWWKDTLGFRPDLQGRLSAPAIAGNGATYTLSLANIGIKGKGLTADGLTVALVVPAGASVVTTTGDGYKGVRMDADLKANVAEWQVGRMAAQDTRTITLTLSQAATATDNVKGMLRWNVTKPRKFTDQLAIAPAPLK